MDKAEPAKQHLCQELLASYGSEEGSVCVLSTQVMQETYVAATRKLRAEPAEAEAVLRSLQSQEIVTITPQLVFEAIECSRRQHSRCGMLSSLPQPPAPRVTSSGRKTRMTAR